MNIEKPNKFFKVLDTNTIILFLILIFAFGIRIYNLTFEGLWTDELISIYASNPYISLQRMYNVLHFWDQTPPLYPILFWAWLKVFGFTEFNARFFSVLGGMLSLVAIYFLIKELYNKSTALIITFILSVTPYHIYFSREVRSYIWAFLILTLLLIFFVKQINNYTKKHNRWAFIALSSLFLYVSYFSFFIHIGLVVFIGLIFLLKLKPIQLKNWIIDYIIIGISYLPWLFPFIRILGFHNSDSVSKPHFTYLFDMFNIYSASCVGGILLLIVYIACFVYFLYYSFYKKNNTYAYVWILFLFFYLFIFILMYLKSATGRNILNGFMYSYVIVLFPVYLILMAGIVQVLPKYMKILFVMGFLLINSMHFQEWKKYSYHKKLSQPYRDIANYIAKTKESNVPIFCSGHYIQEFYFFKKMMSEQIIDSQYFGQKIKDNKTFWVIDSYDLQSKDILNYISQTKNIEILENKSFVGATGNIHFQVYLVHII